ncbi:MAG: phenylalanine--tRNA ligase subunit beta [Chitinophagaceae bacterium]|nr:phenylalanine--tRNA ligase subunit beta [Chitinophagaceae bacterium]
MTISYNWLCDYLPVKPDPQALSIILTSIGLEVESLSSFESIKGGLKGVVTGEVLACEQHPNADKLKLTKVNIGEPEPLQIVCGAPNVAVNQKVIVATIGTTIYPVNGEPLTMKAAKIRGIESQGMICAEDEIGIGTSHAGIIILPGNIKPGTPAAAYFEAYNDWIYEIGLTPNRMDAMSHYGVAKDVCAYLSHHNQKETRPINIYNKEIKIEAKEKIEVKVENEDACQRYSGIVITGIEVKESPAWLKNKLTAIGQRTINNIVDITNFILHETGQPLHAFDLDAIKGKQVIVKTLPENTPFQTLDEKERKLSAEDLVICNAENGMCIAGVFGGLKSGVTVNTKAIFLESAWFNPVSIRKTSLRHDLRTEAANHFEKGVDISNTVNVLKRAAQLIVEVTGASIASEIIDVYPSPKTKEQVTLSFDYLKKLSGKKYDSTTIKNILDGLNFEIVNEDENSLTVAVPYNKPDISLAADLVEEIIRIDGLDNIEIPASITISPSINHLETKENLRSRLAGELTGMGFMEILTNSITNSAYYKNEALSNAVKMINSLSSELNIMRPSMLETGLETIAYNLNRKNTDLKLFEIGKTYFQKEPGAYLEEEKLALYITGDLQSKSWKHPQAKTDLFYLKGIVQSIITNLGFSNCSLISSDKQDELSISLNNKIIGSLQMVNSLQLQVFGIKQPVCYAEINFNLLLRSVERQNIVYEEVSKFPAVERDLAIVINKSVQYDEVSRLIDNLKLKKLQQIRLFDIYEGEKLGEGKKSMALNFIFSDTEKTLTDKEIDGLMNRLMQTFEKELSAEIRK